MNYIEISNWNDPNAPIVKVSYDDARDLARERLAVDRDPTENEILEAAEDLV